MRLKLILLLMIIVILLMYSCHRNDHTHFEGYVEGENIFLASPFYGVLKKLAVQRGQHVTKGQLLFNLDPYPQILNIFQTNAQLEQAQNTLNDLQKSRRIPEIAAAEAQVEQAEADVKLAQLRVSRFKELYSKRATEKDTLDAALANLQHQEALRLQYQANLALAKLGSREDQIKAQQSLVESLSAKLNESRWELAQKTISAPASGVIFDTYFERGEFVGAQQPVLSLLTPENIRIEFFVPLKFLQRIKMGQKITFDCEGCEKNNLAEISYISPDAEYLPPLVYSRENSAKLVFRIKARIKNPTLFKPGEPVLVNLR